MSIELSAIAGFISLCKAAIEAGRMFTDSSLTSEEERLLEHSCHHGLIEMVSHNGLLTVYTDEKIWVKEVDPAERIRYLSAFQSLCKRGSLFPEGDTRFT